MQFNAAIAVIDVHVQGAGHAEQAAKSSHVAAARRSLRGIDRAELKVALSDHGDGRARTQIAPVEYLVNVVNGVVVLRRHVVLAAAGVIVGKPGFATTYPPRPACASRCVAGSIRRSVNLGMVALARNLAQPLDAAPPPATSPPESPDPAHWPRTCRPECCSSATGCWKTSRSCIAFAEKSMNMALFITPFTFIPCASSQAEIFAMSARRGPNCSPNSCGVSHL